MQAAKYSEATFFAVEQEVDRLDTATIRAGELPLWFSGQEVAPEVPLVMTLSDEGNVLPDFFDAGVKVVSTRLREALLALGAPARPEMGARVFELLGHQRGRHRTPKHAGWLTLHRGCAADARAVSTRPGQPVDHRRAGCGRACEAALAWPSV